jgi:hypothetical protein
MQFLNDEVGALTGQKIRGDALPNDRHIPNTAAFNVRTKPTKSTNKSPKGKPNPFCVFCETKDHWAQNCKQITNVEDRIQKLKAASRCFLSLNRGHTLNNCRKRDKVLCSKCKQPHHYCICKDNLVTSTAELQTTTKTPHFTHLQTARIWLRGPSGLAKLTRCVLDAGSQSSFISTSLINQLKLEVLEKREIIITPFESTTAASQARLLFHVDIQGAQTKTQVSLTAMENDNTYSLHPTVPREVSRLPFTSKLQMADRMTSHNLPIEVLIGGEHYWKIIKNTSPSLVLLPSIFGWILSGNRTGVTVHQVSINNNTQKKSVTTGISKP